MNYVNKATAITPALIIFLVDVSASMSKMMANGQTRIQATQESLHALIKNTIYRSIRGDQVSPRYRIGLFCYSDEVLDIYGGFKTITEITSIGLPKLDTMDGADPAKGFRQVKKMLEIDLATWTSRDLENRPAPLIIHISDGLFTMGREDPENIVREIKQISVPDGQVLVENICVSDKIAATNPFTGFYPGDDLGDLEMNRLLRMSSVLPETYKANIFKDDEYHEIGLGTVMMYPIKHVGIFTQVFAHCQLS